VVDVLSSLAAVRNSGRSGGQEVVDFSFTDIMEVVDEGAQDHHS
jgi:hypothetical protein